MTRNVVVAPQAEAQIRTIDAWWRENRPGSPRLFEQELADARLAEAATAALDALESIHDLVALFGLHTAGPDVHALIAIARGHEPNER